MSSATLSNQRSHSNGSVFILLILALAILVYAIIQVTQ